MSNKKLITSDLVKAVMTQARPGITTWNRLEGRARRADFDRSLKAEVHDALWMLTRQWQMGEFLGDDAGSPIATKVQISTRQLTQYQAAGGESEHFSDAIPLEAQVEQMPIPRAAAGRPQALDIRLLAGRHWLKLLRGVAPSLVDAYVAAYPIAPSNPNALGDADVSAHPEALAENLLVAGRRMDGLALYDYLKAAPNNAASDAIATSGNEAQLDALGTRFSEWFERLFLQPDRPPAWLADRLEYQFRVSAPRDDDEQIFHAEEYAQGHLDWYSFEQDDGGERLSDARQTNTSAVHTRTMLPTQVTFAGMPHTRWWKFENGQTNFGNIRPDTTDLGKLLLIEFALIYANDWFLVPFTLDAGTIANVDGVVVTNVFGERVWVEAAGAGLDEDWRRWAMFSVSKKGGSPSADLSLMIPPSAQKVQNSPPREEVMLVRDEMANMVWGIERQVPLPTGRTKRGGDAARETRAFFERELERSLGMPPEPPPMAEGANIRYQVMTSVPENWIPMIPVHRAGQTRQTQLQRASMPRIIPGDPSPPLPVRPRTSLLRQKLDDNQPYYLHEEEVPRAGVRVTQEFQRTRWRDGRVWVWLGQRKQTGRGEASSNLAFDKIVARRRRGS